MEDSMWGRGDGKMMVGDLDREILKVKEDLIRLDKEEELVRLRKKLKDKMDVLARKENRFLSIVDIIVDRFDGVGKKKIKR